MLFINHTSHKFSVSEAVCVLTGTFILNSSLLNLNKMSEIVRWKSVVGLSTSTSCRLPGKEPYKKTQIQRKLRKTSKTGNINTKAYVSEPLHLTSTASLPLSALTHTHTLYILLP